MAEQEHISVESIVARLSRMNIGETLSEYGVPVTRLAKQRWQIDDKKYGVKAGARRLKFILAQPQHSVV